MKVTPLVDKLKKFSAVGMPCTSRELSDLKDGKQISLPIENAELMQQMGLVQIIENKKKTKEK